VKNVKKAKKDPTITRPVLRLGSAPLRDPFPDVLQPSHQEVNGCHEVPLRDSFAMVGPQAVDYLINGPEHGVSGPPHREFSRWSGST